MRAQGGMKKFFECGAAASRRAGSHQVFGRANLTSAKAEMAMCSAFEAALVGNESSRAAAGSLLLKWVEEGDDEERSVVPERATAMTPR
jgi:hypothetical protein